MDSSRSLPFDIFHIYRQYCLVTLGNVKSYGACYIEDDSEISRSPRDGLNDLLNLIQYRVRIRISIFDELMELMSRIDLVADFPHFYDFVFFFCRENHQKNITVRRAVDAWRLVLAGRFRLLNQLCDFVERNQKHNISEDTWRQVLGFSRCVDENLEAYDFHGAWPSLIDDFVEDMYRVSGGSDLGVVCTCEDTEEPFREIKVFRGSKRKRPDSDESVNGAPVLTRPLLSHCDGSRCLSRGFAGLLSVTCSVDDGYMIGW